jgi:hypothetical protein
MKLTYELTRKTFRGWSGAQLIVSPVPLAGFLIEIAEGDEVAQAEVTQEEASRIAEKVETICSLDRAVDYYQRQNTRTKLIGEEGQSLSVGYVNDGEPFREGIRIAFDVEEQWELSRYIDLEQYEARELAKFLRTTK